MQTIELCLTELLEIEPFDHLTVCKRMMFNWIVSDTYKYLKPFNFVDLCKIELLEIELFDYLTVCINNICLQIMYLIYE